MTHKNNIDLDGQEVLNKRQEFFDLITKKLKQEPHRVDELMKQNHYYCEPELDYSNYYSSAEDAVLFFRFSPSFFNRQYHFSYSFFNPGDWFWVGILFHNDGSENNKSIIDNIDNHLELDCIWDRVPDTSEREANETLLEWRFEEPELYTNYAVRERFAYIIRHMHFKINKCLYHHARVLSEDS